MGKKTVTKTEVQSDTSAKIPAADTQPQNDNAETKTPPAAPSAEESGVENKNEADQPAADGTGEGAPSENEEKTDTPDDKPAESETEPEKTAYTVHGCNIRHDGKTYKEGSQIELTDEEASRLKKYLKR